MNTFTPNSLKTLRREIEAALALIDIDGVSFDLGTLRYSPTKCTVTLTVTNSGQADKEADDLAQVVHTYGLKGTKGNRGETLIGYNPRAPRFPFLVKKTDGRTYKFTENGARQIFGEV